MVAGADTEQVDIRKELKRAEGILREQFPDITVFYLFGSSAGGEMRKGSDVDVAVFVRPEKLRDDPLYELKLNDFLEKQLGERVDVVIMNKAGPILQHEVLKHGRRLFETDHRARAELELLSFKRYLDVRYFQRRRRLQEGYG